MINVVSASLNLALVPQFGPPPPPPELVGNAYASATVVTPPGTVAGSTLVQATLKKHQVGNPNGQVLRNLQPMTVDPINPSQWSWTFQIQPADNVRSGDVLWIVVTGACRVDVSDVETSAPARP